MSERAQATVEYVGVAMAVLVLLLAGAAAARAQLRPHPPGDAAYLDLAQAHAPRMVAERGDGEQPVDFQRCRQPDCARGARPVLYVHAVRRDGFVYLEYWEYLPESRTAHLGIAELDGYHRDDWEGVIATRIEWRVTAHRVPHWCRQPDFLRTRAGLRPAAGGAEPPLQGPHFESRPP